VRSLLIIAVCAALSTGCASNDKPPIAIPAREQSMIVDDPQQYQDIFQKLQRAVFVRQGLTEQAPRQ
jgi:hypothetical protein